MKLEQFSAVLIAAGAMAAGFLGCGDDDPAGTGGSTTTSVPPTTSSGGVNPFLASACTSAADCGPEGKCVLPSDNDTRFGGGPPGGYCTRRCSTEADCASAGSLCLKNAAGDGECLLGCEQGFPDLLSLNTALDEDKCRGREDLRCDTIDDISVCVPTCGNDSQCAGRACDPRRAVCVDTPHTGLPLGQECDPQGTSDPCAGFCVNFVDDNFGETGMCSSYCVSGGQNLEVDCGGLTNGLCGYRVLDPTGTGDLGLCAKACLAHDDCTNPFTWCVSIKGLTGDMVPNGYCFGGMTECTDQGDCKIGETCTPTPDGSLCLDARFPLSSQGAGGGGGGGGGAGGGGGH